MLQTIRRYTTLWFELVKMSFMAEIEYKANFLAKVVADFFWYAAQLSTFEVLYHRTSAITAWSLAEVRVFMAVLFLVDSVYMILYHENMENLGPAVIRGDLDLLLAKPIDEQFFLSLQRVNVSYLINMLLVTTYLIWCLMQLPDAVGWTRILAFIVCAIAGNSLIYSIRLAFAACAMIVGKSEAIVQLWYQAYRLAIKPDTMYPKWIKVIIFTVVPMAFMASVPARVLLGKLTMIWMFIAACVAVLFLLVTRRWWKFCLSKYTSASS
jgi:ABC-2 type transport system permease protein